MMGAGKGAENGILFKGGEYLEIANKVTTILRDSFFSTTCSTIEYESIHPLWICKGELFG
jgi:Cu+-exporting ATPase